jgi:5,10-methylenetetrahydrofolate reductase
MPTPELMLARSLARASFEVSPPQVLRLGTRLGSFLRPQTNVFVTSLAHGSRDDTLNACRAIADAGSKPVPHIAARSFASFDELGDFLKRIAEIEIAQPNATSADPVAGTQLGNVAKADQVLLIAGDLTPPAGCIKDTLQVRTDGVFVQLAVVLVCSATRQQELVNKRG